MKKVIIILALFAALTLPAHAIDPLEPEPGGLSQQEIKELEAEREAARLIDQQVSRGGQKVMVMEATAYTWTGHKTATGTWPSRGTVAVDPEVIPLGTKLYIEGYGPAVAADTGGDIVGNRIDLYMDTEAECWQWGRRQVDCISIRLTEIPGQAAEQQKAIEGSKVRGGDALAKSCQKKDRLETGAE